MTSMKLSWMLMLSAIKAYDSVTGADVTDKFDISVENGVITANLKAWLH